MQGVPALEALEAELEEEAEASQALVPASRLQVLSNLLQEMPRIPHSKEEVQRGRLASWSYAPARPNDRAVAWNFAELLPADPVPCRSCQQA